MRITLADVRQSRLPGVIGKCAADLPYIAAAVNAATQRLINSGGETGWWCGWSRVVFNVTSTNPYITLPRSMARIINLDVCKQPIRTRNEFYEFLPGGIGLMPRSNWPDFYSPIIEGYERGVVPTMVDLPGTQVLRAYLTNSADVGKRLLITGLDANGNDIYTLDNGNNVRGVFLTLASPFVNTAFPLSTIDSVQKDVTLGDVVLKSVDPVSGAETTLSRYAPTEVNPAYRRYMITQLPNGCCTSGQATTLQITALAKLEYIPVYLDTDQLIISNIEALIAECQAIRYEAMDTTNALTLAQAAHMRAIRQLQNEQRHYLGEQRLAVQIDINQGSPLESHGVGIIH